MYLLGSRFALIFHIGFILYNIFDFCRNIIILKYLFGINLMTLFKVKKVTNANSIFYSVYKWNAFKISRSDMIMINLAVHQNALSLARMYFVN